MQLPVFRTIDETLCLLDKKNTQLEKIRRQVKRFWMNFFIDKQEAIVDVTSRVKGKESLREKIIRNRLYIEKDSPQQILADLSDLIGFAIECRFIDEENEILQELRSRFTIPSLTDDGYSRCEENAHLFLELNSPQPQMQKNGFSIYRIDGYYVDHEEKVRFELQIKSLVHMFWGEIEHKLVYKNSNFYVYDNFMKEILASIMANLTILDKQLRIVYKQMDQMSRDGHGMSEHDFEQVIIKAINDLFLMKMSASIGFTLNIKNTSSILGHYLFIKDFRNESKNSDQVSRLFATFKKLNSVDLDFENEIRITGNFSSSDVFIDTLGNYLLSIINFDYDWYVFFKMLFVIEPGDDLEDFSLFLKVIKNYLVDSYWLDTSFARLPLAESEQIHHDLWKILADALVEIGSIRMIHDDKMIMINQAFVEFVNELEERVISYDDFRHYKEAYYEEWLKRIHRFF